MDAAFLGAQALNGLSHATTLFLMASGLGLVFGVTRIVNFAHGSFYMLGAYGVAHAVTLWWPSWGDNAVGYGVAMLLAVLFAAVLGWGMERIVLRRLVGSPELVALVATFGLSLVLHDLMRWVFGVQEVFAPRFPGLKGSVEWAGVVFPTYHIVTMLLGPLVWLGLHLLLHRTTYGARLRAATQDQAMLGALGVNPAPLLGSAVALGSGLAALGGALSVPTSPVHLQMDLQIIVETFVVVVTGGLGSMAGAFLAATVLGLVHAFGTAWWPQASLVWPFAVMALVLLWRPSGLLGKGLMHAGSGVVSGVAAGAHFAQIFTRVSMRTLLAVMVALVLGFALVKSLGAFATSVWMDAMVLLLFALSLQMAMSLAGLVSFGHAAYFGVGAYGAALTQHAAGGVLAATLLALVFGAVVIRSSGVYLATLSLALAQVLWALASQWTALTGGDNGLIGLASSFGVAGAEGAALGWVEVATLVLVMLALLGLQALGSSRLGLALQAARDAPARAAASGVPVIRLRYAVYVASAAGAALAGSLMVWHKGSVFPSSLSVSTSLDALLVLLLGGAHHVLGTLLGSAVMTLLASELGRWFDYWRGFLGLAVLLLMLYAPKGLLGGKSWGRTT